jgi:hypothetical protein
MQHTVVRYARRLVEQPYRQHAQEWRSGCNRPQHKTDARTAMTAPVLPAAVPYIRRIPLDGPAAAVGKVTVWTHANPTGGLRRT